MMAKTFFRCLAVLRGWGFEPVIGASSASSTS